MCVVCVCVCVCCVCCVCVRDVCVLCVCVYVMCVLCVCAWCVCVCVCVCVCHHFVCLAEVPRLLCSCTVTWSHASHILEMAVLCVHACMRFSFCLCGRSTQLQQCTPNHTHSPLPLLAPAEGTQGQVSWYKQLLPSVQGRGKGEGPYVCKERNSTSFLEGTVACYSHAHLDTHSHHLYTTHTHTINNTHILACSMASKIAFISD